LPNYGDLGAPDVDRGVGSHFLHAFTFWLRISHLNFSSRSPPP
jgi:hypothetical protein